MSNVNVYLLSGAGYNTIGLRPLDIDDETPPFNQFYVDVKHI